MKILFVCSSNICRSPYAEFWFKKMVSESDILQRHIESVHSAAVFNKMTKLHEKAVACLLSEGFSEEELLAYRPAFKKGDEAYFQEADVIIGMTKSHKMYTPKEFRNKFTTLSEIANEKYVKIDDPFLSRNQEEYNEIMRTIYFFLEQYRNNLEQDFVNEELSDSTKKAYAEIKSEN